jgi:hypothetical protein
MDLRFLAICPPAGFSGTLVYQINGTREYQELTRPEEERLGDREPSAS